MTGDHLSLRIQDQIPIIKTRERFARACLAQPKAACNNGLPRQRLEGVGIESMQGLPLLHHHMVGDINDGVDTVDAGPLKALFEPALLRAGTIDILDQCEAVEASPLKLHGTVLIAVENLM